MYKKDLELQRKMGKASVEIGDSIGKRPKDLNSTLFLISVQELGIGPKNFTKEEKQDLMHIAICKVLSYSGYYELKRA